MRAGRGFASEKRTFIGSSSANTSRTFHLDVIASSATLSDNFYDDPEGEFLVGGAVGFDLGSRSKGQDAMSWTGATFTLRGFYTTHEAAGFEVQGGLYAW